MNSQSHVTKDGAESKEDSGPEDEESLLMKQMMGFSKFDTTKVRNPLVGFAAFTSSQMAAIKPRVCCHSERLREQNK